MIACMPQQGSEHELLLKKWFEDSIAPITPLLPLYVRQLQVFKILSPCIYHIYTMYGIYILRYPCLINDRF